MIKEESMSPGIIFNIQRFCTHDGPGVRSTLFIKGCPLRCKWCSNPESQNGFPELLYKPLSCIKCGACIACCPHNALSIVDNQVAINREKCNLCGSCEKHCTTQSLEVAGRQQPVAEIVAELIKDRPFFEMSNGGVTLSGGEALAHIEFARAILQGLRSEGIHTAVETSGYVRTAEIMDIAKLVDLFLYDIKQVDRQKHIWGTQASNELIIKNLTALALSGAAIAIRYPLIPGFNSDEKSLSLVVKLMKELGLREIHILPYHRLGSAKYKYLGRQYELGELNPPGKEAVEQVRNYFLTKNIEKVFA